jgi:hypothetical protein
MSKPNGYASAERPHAASPPSPLDQHLGSEDERQRGQQAEGVAAEDALLALQGLARPAVA